MLMRTDPFRELDRLTQQLSGQNGTWSRPAVMPMDAYREGEQYVVHFDLPGVEPSSIDLNVERNVLTVKAERTHSYGEDVELHVAERPCGVFPPVVPRRHPGYRSCRGQLRGRGADHAHPHRRKSQAPQD
jgi:HSP20 family protein